MSSTVEIDEIDSNNVVVIGEGDENPPQSARHACCKCKCSWKCCKSYSWCCIRSTPVLMAIFTACFFVGIIMATSGYASFYSNLIKINFSLIQKYGPTLNTIVHTFLACMWPIGILSCVGSLCVTGWFGEELVEISAKGMDSYHTDIAKRREETKALLAKVEQETNLDAAEEEKKEINNEKWKMHEDEGMLCCIYSVYYSFHTVQSLTIILMYVGVVIAMICMCIFVVITVLAVVAYEACSIGAEQICSDEIQGISLGQMVYRYEPGADVCQCDAPDYTSCHASPSFLAYCNMISPIMGYVIAADLGLGLITCCGFCMWGTLIGNSRRVKTLMLVAEDEEIQKELYLYKLTPEMQVALDTPVVETETVPTMGNGTTGDSAFAMSHTVAV